MKAFDEEEFNNMFEYVSVSDFAKHINKTTATVYNMIRGGLVEYKTFQRGSMIGYLVKKRKTPLAYGK